MDAERTSLAQRTPPPPPPRVCVRVFVRVSVHQIVHNHAHGDEHSGNSWMLLTDNSSQPLRTWRAQRRSICAPLWGQHASPLPAEVRVLEPPLLCAQKCLNKINKGRKCERSAPLTLVGSPPLIHLLQRKFNTMDLPVKFAGRRTEKAAHRAEPEQKRGHGKPQDAWTVLPFPRDTAAKQREKVTSSNSCYTKMELAVAEPIRARLRRLPLLCGLEPNTTALATSQDFQFTGIFHNNHSDSL